MRPQKRHSCGSQPQNKAAMLGVNTIEFFSKNEHENRVWLPEERNAFVLDHQHGRRDFKCKPAILTVGDFTKLAN